MQKWEYMLYTVTGAKEQDVIVDFNNFGLEGWEFVALIPIENVKEGRAVFKRQKQGSASVKRQPGVIHANPS